MMETRAVGISSCERADEVRVDEFGNGISRTKTAFCFGPREVEGEAHCSKQRS